MGSCGICEDIQCEEYGIRELPWYTWWKWTWKVKLKWRAWRHDRNDHQWEWKVKLRMVWAYNIYWSIKDRYMDWRLEMVRVKLVEFYCRTCDDFMFRDPSSKECYKCGGLIKRKKSTVEDMSKLTKKLDEEKERGS